MNKYNQRVHIQKKLVIKLLVHIYATYTYIGTIKTRISLASLGPTSHQSMEEDIPMQDPIIANANNKSFVICAPKLTSLTRLYQRKKAAIL